MIVPFAMGKLDPKEAMPVVMTTVPFLSQNLDSWWRLTAAEQGRLFHVPSLGRHR